MTKKTIRHNSYLIIIPIVSLLIALLLRLKLGSNLMFYVYHDHINFFPCRISYSLLYIIRILICSFYMAITLIQKLRRDKRLIARSLLSLITIYLEYWLVFFKESIITVILFSVLILVVNFKYVKINLLSKNDSYILYILISLFCVIEFYMIICILSIII